jgi:hypothetical protein
VAGVSERGELGEEKVLEAMPKPLNFLPGAWKVRKTLPWVGMISGTCMLNVEIWGHWFVVFGGFDNRDGPLRLWSDIL